MNKQLVATIYIVDQAERVLLIYHKKLKKWLPPGGHINPNESPPEAAVREASEETGLDVALLFQENVWIKSWNASSIPRPFLCLLEEIPAYKDEPAHQHMDMIYVGRPVGGIEKHQPKEVQEMRWFTSDELLKLKPEEEIFAETLDVIAAVFQFVRMNSVYT